MGKSLNHRSHRNGAVKNSVGQVPTQLLAAFSAALLLFPFKAVEAQSRPGTVAQRVPDRPTEPHDGMVRVKYDHIDEETTVSLSGVIVAMDGLQFGGVYRMAGQTPKRPKAAALHLMVDGETWQYLKCNTLTLLIDGKRVPLGDAEHDGSVGRKGVLEQMMWNVPTEMLLRIANAKDLEGKLCTTPLAFSESAHLAWRDFASRMKATP